MTERYLVVITDSAFESGDKEQAILEGIGAKVQKFSCSSELEVIEATRNAHVVLADTAPVTRNVIQSLQKAKGVVAYGAGYDNIDVDAATEMGILVCNNPDFMTYEVADHAIALVLALTRKLHEVIPSTRELEWNWKKFAPIRALDGMTAGVVGFGNIGRNVAKRFHAFDMEVLVYDPYVERKTIERLGARPVTLEQLLRECDVISIHVPLTKETRGLVGKNELALIKKSAILVNTSRGAVIDQEALTNALQRGKIAAAGLDVLVEEPPDKSDPILKLKNVIITPHIGWYSEQSSARLQENAALEAERILKGQTPRHLLNSQVLSEGRKGKHPTPSS